MVVEIAPTVQRPLVQVTELDPEAELRFIGGVTADASVGILQLTCLAPIDKSVFWVSGTGAVTGGSTSDVQYNIETDGGDVIWRMGGEGFAVGGNQLLTPLRPPLILISPQEPGNRVELQIIVDNVLGDDLAGEAIAFIWDAQIGRNLPQKFFWPATL